MKNIRCFWSIFWRSFLIQSLWNFERMQNVGFCFSIYPLIKNIYKDPKELKEALLRHLNFFNTHPYMANIILGIVAVLETEQKDAAINQEKTILTIKSSMGGPLAAIGDTFFWATLRPFVTILTVGLIIFFYNINDFRGTFMPIFFFLIVFNSIHIPFRYWSQRMSIKYKTNIVEVIAGLEFQQVIRLIRVISSIILLVVLSYYILYFITDKFDRLLCIYIFLLTLLLTKVGLPPALIFYTVIFLSFLI